MCANTQDLQAHSTSGYTCAFFNPILLIRLFVAMTAALSNRDSLPAVLTIATSDSSGGAGIQSDLLTFAANKAYGLSAFAALTAQHPDGVSAIHQLPPAFLQAQLEQNATFYRIAAAKTGMLFAADLIETTADFIAQKAIPTVVDPVMVATSGARLLKDDALESLKKHLLPHATLITPNLDEAGVLLGYRPSTQEDIARAGHQLYETYGCAVLMKGGHMEGDILIDLLVDAQGQEHRWESRRVLGVDTHGSGCTLSAAIAAFLARDYPLAPAVGHARAYLLAGLQSPIRLSGRNFIAKFPKEKRFTASEDAVLD